MRARLRKTAMRVGVGTLTIAAAWLTLRVFPSLLFGYACAGTVLTLHAEAPLPTVAAERVAHAEALVRRSPIFVAGRHHDLYLAGSRWSWQFLTGGNTKAAGVAFAPLGRGMILRGGDIENNRARQANGGEAPGERTLEMYMAHELTHELTEEYLGARHYRALPHWVREGYADYVGRGADFDYDDARAALLGTIRVRAIPQTGAYLTYTLLIAHVLEKEHWTVDQLLRAPPPRDAVEARLRAGTISAAP